MGKISFKFDAVGVTQLRSLSGYFRGLVDVKDLTPEIIKEGVRFAKSIAPHDTGSLRNAIHGQYGLKNAGVYVRVPDHPDGRKRPYMLWHHGLGVYSQVRTGDTKPTSGNGAFLYATTRYIRRIAKGKYRQRIKQNMKKWQK